MNITDGINNAGMPLRTPELPEGEFSAVVKEAKIVNKCKTQYGFNDAIEITYTVNHTICDIEKKERLYISNSKTSKCQQLINQLYGDSLPDSINLNDHLGRKCLLTIKHNADSIGNVYDNIVDRRFI